MQKDLYIFYYTKGYPKREGTAKDAIAMEELLKEIGFHDVRVYQDRTHLQAMTVIKT